MMPAFAQSEGGPLNDQQIAALTEYLVKTIPNKLSAASSSPAPASTSGFPVPVAP